MHHRRTHINNHLAHQAIWLHQICMVNLLPMSKHPTQIRISHIHIHHGKVISKMVIFLSWETYLQNKMCGHWLKNISHQYFICSNFGIILYVIGQPGGFVQTPMNPPHMTQPPMGGGQQQVVIVTNTRWGPSPMIITCPHCTANITTSITSEPGAFAWIFGALLCFVG